MKTTRAWLWVVAMMSVAASFGAMAPGCSDSASTDDNDGTVEPLKVTPAEFGKPFDKLSEWHLFADIPLRVGVSELHPYDVASPLFSDYTTKFRWLYIPPDKKVHLADDGTLEFPEGSILVKTFAYPADIAKPNDGLRLIETRLMWLEPTGWSTHTYIYDETGKDAKRVVAGKFIPFDFVGPGGKTVSTQYRVPNTNECKDCHQNDDKPLPLGLKLRQLDRIVDGVNQIDDLAAAGIFDAAPPPAADRVHLVDPADAGESLDVRVRSYFDANCGHCHTKGGMASQSSLLLDFTSTAPGAESPANFGVCKIPTSAGGATCGLTFDVVPGKPEESIMACRLGSTEIEVRMPPLGSRIVHEEGLALVNDWIASLEGGVCE